MSEPITITLKDGTPYTISPEMQQEFLFKRNAPSALPSADSAEGGYLTDTFSKHGIDVYGQAQASAQEALVNPSSSYTPEQNTNAYYYEQQLQSKLERIKDNGLMADLNSESTETQARAAAKLSINQYLSEQDPSRMQDEAKAIELDIRNAQDALGRPLLPEEIKLYTQAQSEKRINETLDDVGDNLPLQLLADPRVQALMDSQTLKALTGKWKADHPVKEGFFAGWDRASALGDIKGREVNIALRNKASEILEEQGLFSIADMVKSDEKSKDWNTIAKEMNMIDLTYASEGGAMHTAGDVLSGLVSPYASLGSMAVMGAAVATRNPHVISAASGVLDAYDYYQGTAFDIAYQASQINPKLRDNFSDAIIAASPEAVGGAVTEGVVSGFILGGGLKAGSKIVKSLRDGAKKAPSVNQADNALADKIETNSQKFRDSALGGFLEGFAKTYPMAFGAQAATTGLQGALTQHGINRLAEQEQAGRTEAGLKAIKDNLGTIAVLSLIPGGLSGLGYAVSNKQTSAAFEDHGERLESEAMATSAPVSDLSPAAAEQLFSLLGDKQYRFSAHDIVQKYKDMGLSKDEFLQRFELKKDDFKDLEELASTGGDIVMAKSHWDAYYAKQLTDGTPEVYEFFNPLLRTDKTDISLDELKEKVSPENIARFRQELLDDIKELQIGDDLESHIRADITSKLRENQVGKASFNDYLTALHANLFHSLQSTTGIDGKQLYDTYKSEFKNVADNALNLTGEVRPEDIITQKGGMYDPNTNTYTLTKDSTIVTAVHEFGHALLNTLNRIAQEPDFKGDKSKVVETLNGIKEILGYDKSAPIDEKMQEKFVSALLGTIVAKRDDLIKDKKGVEVEQTDKAITTTNFAKFSPQFDKMRRSMAMSLYSTYQDLKKEFDKKVESGEDIDVAQQLATQEYRERFGDDNFSVTQDMRDFFSKYVLGNLAFEQHVQLSGLHGVFDATVLKEHFPEHAAQIDELNLATSNALDNLRSSHEQLQEIMTRALRMGLDELDAFKRELIRDYKQAKHNSVHVEERLQKELNQKRKEFIKETRAKRGEEYAKRAGDKAYEGVINRGKNAFKKDLQARIRQEQKDFNSSFKDYMKAQSLLMKAQEKAQELNKNGKANEEQLKEFNDYLSTLGDGKFSSGQAPVFKVQFDNNGLINVVLEHPLQNDFLAFAAKDNQGNILFTPHPSKGDTPAYSSFELDKDLVSQHFKERFDKQVQDFAPDEQLRAQADEARNSAKPRTNSEDKASIEREANEYIESIRDDVSKQVEEQLNKEGFSTAGAPDEDLRKLLACLDAVKSLKEKTDKATNLQKAERANLESSISWKLLEYFRAEGNTTDKLNYHDAVRLLGFDTARQLLDQGAAALDGEITFDRFATEGPLKSLLSGADSSLTKRLEKEAESLASKGLGKKLTPAEIEHLKPVALGIVVARKMSEYGLKSADNIVKERVMNKILKSSNGFILDALKDNPTIQDLISNAFDKVSRAERNLFNKLSKDIKTHTQTNIKRLSDSVLSKTKLADFSVFRLNKAQGKARDKAYQLAFDLTKGPEHMAKIADQLNLNAVLSQTLKDGTARLNVIGKQLDDIKAFLRKGNKDVAKDYDLNTILLMRVAASRIGIASDSAGAQAKRLIDNNAPKQIKELMDSLSKDDRFNGFYKNHTIPKMEEALMLLNALKSRAKAMRELDKELEGKEFAELSKEVVDRLAKVKKASIAYKTDGTERSWSADPLTKAHRWIGITFRTYLVKMEQWCKNIDRSDNGPLLRIIYDPIRKAYDEAAIQKRQAQLEANELIKKAGALKNHGVIKTTMTDGNGKKITFGLSGKYKGNGTMELMTFLTHIGNESNLDKLLRGMGIEREQFTSWFNEAQKSGIITKEMMDVVQAYWDFNAKYWPQLQQAYQKASGMYVKEVPPREVLTSFGSYKGGYAPAMRDSDLTIGPLDKDGNLDNLITGNALGDFFGEASFMKERSDAFAQQLRLDFAQQLSNTVSVIHYAHMLAPATKLYRMVNNPDTKLKELINLYQPEFVDTNLVPWLSRTLRDSSSNSPANGMAFNVLRTFTNRVGISFMFANLSNAAQGVTNLLVAASYIKPSYIVSSLTNAIFNYGKLRADMTQSSIFMKQRMDAGFDKTAGETMDLELIRNQDINFALKNSKAAWEHSKQFMNHYGYFAQIYSQHFLDTVVWTAAKEDALARGMSNEDAIKHADSSIRLTQGSNDVLDINNVEAGGPILKMFTQFTSYFNTLSNLVMVELRRNMGDNPARIATALRCAHSLALVVVIPAIISDWIAEAFKGNNVFSESEDWQEFMLMHALIPTGKMFSALVPVYGSAGTVAVTQLTGGQTFGGLVGTPATIGALENSIKLARSVVTDSEPSKPWQDGLTALGVITGIPMGTAVGRRLDYASTVGIDSFDEALRFLYSGNLSDKEKEKYR